MDVGGSIFSLMS